MKTMQSFDYSPSSKKQPKMKYYHPMMKIKSHKKWERVTNNCPLYVLLRDTHGWPWCRWLLHGALERPPNAVSTPAVGPEIRLKETHVFGLSTALY